MTRNPSIAARLFVALRRELLEAQLDRELFGDTCPEQRAFARDVAKRLAALCTRRSGKSRTAIRRLLRRALATPGARIVYINETRGECERIAWHGVNGDGLVPLLDKLTPLLKELGLSADIDNTKLRVKLSNGAHIQLIGADDEAAINKLRGGAYHEVLIDEAQKLPHLRALIESVLGPAMLDFGGTITMVGTPGKQTIGLFYEVTSAENPPGAWSSHTWSCVDNPYFGRVVGTTVVCLGGEVMECGTAEAADIAAKAERYRVTVQAYLDETGKALDDPDVLREFFAQWVQVDANYCYPVHAVEDLCYAPARLDVAGAIDWQRALADLPTNEGRPYEWLHVLGVDLGYSPDPFAFVVWSWTRDLPGVWELGSWKRAKLQPEAQLEVLVAINELLRPVSLVADAGGVGKGVVAGWSLGWQERAPLPITEAKKSDKLTNIEWMGNDIRRGLVHARSGGAWLTEAQSHLWITTGTGKLVENPTTDNHCLDAGLYAFRESSHYRSEIPVEPPKYGSVEYYAAVEAQMEEAFSDGDEQNEW